MHGKKYKLMSSLRRDTVGLWWPWSVLEVSRYLKAQSWYRPTECTCSRQTINHPDPFYLLAPSREPYLCIIKDHTSVYCSGLSALTSPFYLCFLSLSTQLIALQTWMVTGGCAKKFTRLYLVFIWVVPWCAGHDFVVDWTWLYETDEGRVSMARSLSCDLSVLWSRREVQLWPLSPPSAHHLFSLGQPRPI